MFSHALRYFSLDGLTRCDTLYVGRQSQNYVAVPPQTAVKTLDFVFFEAGGGHKAAANALKCVIEQQQRGWEVRLVNLQEILDPLDIFRKYTGIRMEDVYNFLLKKGWTLGTPQ